MKTEVLMSREILGDIVHQKSKSEFFSATDLFRVGNKWRASNGLDYKTMQDYLQVKSNKEFIAEVEEKHGRCLISGRGRGKHSWVHPLIFVDMALWLNPKLRIEVYEWLFDSLLKYRKESGDSYKKMCGALLPRSNQTDYIKNIQKLGKLIQVECGVEDWNKATQDQLELRNRIHENIALLCDIFNDNKQAIRIGIIKAKESLKRE